MADSPRFRGVRVAAQLAMIPLTLGVAPLVGFGLGTLLDRWLHTGQVMRLVFLGLGFAAGVREMLRLLKRTRKDFDEL
jgi:F0F1-type ATP synthase assembly protein I